MKLPKIHLTKNITGLLLLTILAPAYLHAQTDKTELKKQALEAKIDMAEAKVADAEARMGIADSLITSGEKRIVEAEERFEVIGVEQKQLEKDYNSEYKRIKKITKSKVEEEATKAEANLKALEKQFDADIKAYRDEIKTLTKQPARGESDMAKGLEKQRDTISRMKDAEKALEIAQTNYDEFLSSLEDE